MKLVLAYLLLKLGKKKTSSDMEVTIPSHFICPISLDLMKDPVTLSTGITYDRESIEKWIQDGHFTCPVSNQKLSSFDQIPNHFIRRMIQSWCVDNRSNGVERIPTPRAPVTAFEVNEICKKITRATSQGDAKRCMTLVEKVRNWAKGSERERKCVSQNGGDCALSSTFELFSERGTEEHSPLLEELVSVFVSIHPIGVDAERKMGTTSSLRGLKWVLTKGSPTSRKEAAVLLGRLLSSKEACPKELEGIEEELVRLLKEPTSAAVCKATLTIISCMMKARSASAKFAQLGLVRILVDVLAVGDAGTSRRALQALDRACDSQEGRARAYESDLVVPILLSRIGQAPDAASESAVSVLWKLWKNEKREGRDVVGEIVAMGEKMNPFQKLLVLLQVGCGRDTKEKIKDLLKSLNVHRTKLGGANPALHIRYLKIPN